MHILVLNGPNLNLLGTREPDVYGTETLGDIAGRLAVLAQELAVTVEHMQSNHEGELIDRLHLSKGKVDAVILNPGGFTHTSVALRDALLGVAIPFVEVHLSNVYARESFRRHSYFSDVALGVISGLGSAGYDLALRFLAARSPVR